MRLGDICIPKNPNKALLYLTLTMVILEEYLISRLGVPASLRYVNDLAVLVLFLCCLPAMGAVLRKTRLTGTVGMIVLYVLVIAVGLVWNGGSALRVAWAFRNTFRFFAFFVICVCLLDKDDVFFLLDWLCRLQWLNLALCLYQAFVLHTNQDRTGGIFGTAMGCNAYQNVYLCIVLTYMTCRFMNKECTLASFLATLVCTILVAAVSELRMMFLEIGLILLLVVLVYKPSKKTVGLILGTLALIPIGILILKQLFPYQYRQLMGFANILDYSQDSSTTAYRLGRLGSFPLINDLFFQGDVMRNLFGLGFGNCEYSSFAFLQSPFYLNYGYYNYRWFSHQMLFLETGYLGVFSYCGILISMIRRTWRTKLQDAASDAVRKFVVIFGVLTLMNLWYNSAARTEAGYLIYFALSTAAVLAKSCGEEGKTQEAENGEN